MSHQCHERRDSLFPEPTPCWDDGNVEIPPYVFKFWKEYKAIECQCGEVVGWRSRLTKRIICKEQLNTTLDEIAKEFQNVSTPSPVTDSQEAWSSSTITSASAGNTIRTWHFCNLNVYEYKINLTYFLFSEHYEDVSNRSREESPAPMSAPTVSQTEMVARTISPTPETDRAKSPAPVVARANPPTPATGRITPAVHTDPPAPATARMSPALAAARTNPPAPATARMSPALAAARTNPPGPAAARMSPALAAARTNSQAPVVARTNPPAPATNRISPLAAPTNTSMEKPHDQMKEEDGFQAFLKFLSPKDGQPIEIPQPHSAVPQSLSSSSSSSSFPSPSPAPRLPILPVLNLSKFRSFQPTPRPTLRGPSPGMNNPGRNFH